MSLDISNLFKGMASSAGKVLQENGADLGDEVLSVINRNKASLAELVDARISGDISEEDFNSELEREKLVLEAELLTLEIATKSAIQKAMSAAMETLTKSVALVV